MFGANAPPIGSVGQSNYEGLRFLEAVATRAGSLAMRAVALGRAATWSITARADASAIRNGHGRMPIYLAEADGLDFKLIREF